MTKQKTIAAETEGNLEALNVIITAKLTSKLGQSLARWEIIEEVNEVTNEFLLFKIADLQYQLQELRDLLNNSLPPKSE